MQQLTDCGLLKPGAGWAEIRDVVERIDLKADRMVCCLALPEISDAQLAATQQRLKSGRALKRLSGREPPLELVTPGRPVFSGGRTWVTSPDGRSLASSATPDAALIGALQRSHAIVGDHGLSPQSSLEENRQGRGVSDAYHRALARLAFLAPDIQAAILEGTQPASLSLERLIKKPIPIAWSAQSSGVRRANPAAMDLCLRTVVFVRRAFFESSLFFSLLAGKPPSELGHQRQGLKFGPFGPITGAKNRAPTEAWGHWWWGVRRGRGPGDFSLGVRGEQRGRPTSLEVLTALAALLRF